MALTQNDKEVSAEISRRLVKHCRETKDYLLAQDGFDNEKSDMLLHIVLRLLAEKIAEDGFTVTHERIEEVDRLDNNELVKRAEEND